MSSTDQKQNESTGEDNQEWELNSDDRDSLSVSPKKAGSKDEDKLVNDIQVLPPKVKRRIKALKNLQVEAIKVEAKFFEELHQLECKYQSQYQPFNAKRQQIVAGWYEPNDEECDFPSDVEDNQSTHELLNEELKKKVSLKDSETPQETTEETTEWGIPNFWLTIFQNVALISDMIQPHDEDILKHLTDVKVLYSPDPMGFVLEFHFAVNKYFRNSVLTKEYDIKCEPDPTDIFGFEGPEIYRCKGCVIDWYPNMNVTIKSVKKKQRHKSKGFVRYVNKVVQNDSFFNFFNTQYVPDDGTLDETTEELLQSDFQIGHFFKERLVPRAVLYFTGEALDEEGEMEEEEEGEGEEEEDDDDEEEDSKKRYTVDNSAKQENCKQQ